MEKCHEIKKNFQMSSLLVFVVISISCQWSFTIASEIPTPPYFIKQPRHEVLFQVASLVNEQEKPFVLDCEARGRPDVKYSWSKNGLVFQSEVYGNRISRQSNRGTLTFFKPVDDDEGLYQCNATNIYGTAMSNAVFVRKSELNSFPNLDPKSEAVEEGKPFTMECNPPSGFPKPTIFWIMQSPTGGLQTLNSSRMTVDPEGNLHFSNVTVNDGSDENFYACSANSFIRNEYKLGNKVRLDVIASGSSVAATVPPTKQYESPPNTVALRGDSLRLHCIYGGTPLPEVTWRKKGGVLPQGRYTYENYGKTLRIKPVRITDEGSYECEISNGIGTAKSHVMSVAVQASPYWTKVPDSLNKAEEESVTFECEARGSPEPKLQWFINGVPLAKSEVNTRRTYQGNKLTITDLKKTDTAVYQCNASNTHGYVYDNFFVNVMSLPPTIVKRPEDVTQAVMGSTVTISCMATGAPVPEIIWKKDNVILTGGKYNIEKEGLKIVRATKSDEGVYSCEAINKIDTDQASGSLMIKSKTVLITKPTDLEVAAGKRAVFRCNAKADDSLPLDIVWLRNGLEIDSEFEPRLQKMDDNSLSISKTVELDSGKYVCVARTPLDEVTSAATLTVQDVPNRPILESASCSRNNAVIKWRPNGDNRAAISQYIVQYNTSYTPDTWTTSYPLVPPNRIDYEMFMKPYANYSFRVIAENIIGQSPSSVHSNLCTTPPDRPYKNPDNVVGYGTTSTNLIIKWTVMPKIDHNGPGFKYRIKWKRNDVPNAEYQSTYAKWDVSSIEIKNQPTFKPYKIQVEAVNNRGEANVAADEVIGYSGEDVPLEAPKNFSLVEILGPRTSRFRWLPVNPKSIRGHFVGYKIQVWTVDSSGEKDIGDYKVGPDRTETQISQLIPNAENYVHIFAYNRAYNGPPSDIFRFRTPEGVPGAVAEMVAFPMGASVLQLKWEKPNEPNGVLTGYKITYKLVEGTSFPNTGKIKEIPDADITETPLDGLDPGKTYRIAIKAKTSQGYGEEYFIEVTMKSNITRAPDAPRIEISEFPEDEGKSNLRIQVLPKMDGNSGSEFHVQHRRKGESQWLNMKLESGQWYTVLRGLEPNTDYEIRAVAYEKQFSSASKPKTVKLNYSGRVYSVRAKSLEEEDDIMDSLWLIIMLLAIGLLLILLFLVCLIKRNRGGKYSVHKKEAAQGRDLDYPDNGGFNEYSKPMDGMNPKGSRASLNSSVKNPESETDSMAEYGDGEGGQFTEDGSFIGQYGAKNRKERSDQNATSPSALATFV